MLFSRNPSPQEKEQSWVEGDTFPRTRGAPPGRLACPETVRLYGWDPTLCKGPSILFTQNLTSGALISPCLPLLLKLGPLIWSCMCSHHPPRHLARRLNNPTRPKSLFSSFASAFITPASTQLFSDPGLHFLRSPESCPELLSVYSPCISFHILLVVCLSQPCPAL